MHIKKGEKIAIIGESGSGKTTLLNIIHGELAATSGRIAFAGQSLSRQEITSVSSYILKIAITLTLYLWKTISF